MKFRVEYIMQFNYTQVVTMYDSIKSFRTSIDITIYDYRLALYLYFLRTKGAIYTDTMGITGLHFG